MLDAIPAKPKHPIVGATYRHFKGALYKVIGLALHSEHLGWMVVYQEINTEQLWVRPVHLWNQMVDHHPNDQITVKVPRFAYVSND